MMPSFQIITFSAAERQQICSPRREPWEWGRDEGSGGAAKRNGVKRKVSPLPGAGLLYRSGPTAHAWATDPLPLRG
jgi:hypothetical protein